MQVVLETVFSIAGDVATDELLAGVDGELELPLGPATDKVTITFLID